MLPHSRSGNWTPFRHLQITRIQRSEGWRYTFLFGRIIARGSLHDEFSQSGRVFSVSAEQLQMYDLTVYCVKMFDSSSALRRAKYRVIKWIFGIALSIKVIFLSVSMPLKRF